MLALEECADGDNTIAFGFICDVSEQPATAKGFALGREKELAECLAHLLDEEMFNKILTMALSMRIKEKLNKFKINDNESGHSNLN